MPMVLGDLSLHRNHPSNPSCLSCSQHPHRRTFLDRHTWYPMQMALQVLLCCSLQRNYLLIAPIIEQKGRINSDSKNITIDNRGITHAVQKLDFYFYLLPCSFAGKNFRIVVMLNYSMFNSFRGFQVDNYKMISSQMGGNGNGGEGNNFSCALDAAHLLPNNLSLTSVITCAGWGPFTTGLSCNFVHLKWAERDGGRWMHFLRIRICIWLWRQKRVPLVFQPIHSWWREQQ